MEEIGVSEYQVVGIRRTGNQETLSLTIDDSSWLFGPFVVKTYLKNKPNAGLQPETRISKSETRIESGFVHVHSWFKTFSKMYKNAQKIYKNSHKPLKPMSKIRITYLVSGISSNPILKKTNPISSSLMS